MIGALPLISPEAISAGKSAAQIFPVYGYARAELEVSKIRFGLEGSVRAADLISPPAPTPPSIGDLISVEQGKPPPLQPAVSASAYIKGTF
jgi:hypothetical protein